MYIDDFENELVKGVCETIYLQDTVLLSEIAGGFRK